MYQRNTVQRKVILETVKKLKNHPTADEVYFEVIKEYPSISKATVYRGLHELSSSGEIKYIAIPGGADHYDHYCADHYHIRCSVCGRVFDVDMDYQSEMLEKVKDTHGFKFTGCDIVFKGICPNCQNNNNI